MKILEKEFSLKELLEFTADASNDVKIYNSCFTKQASLDYLLNEKVNEFNPIVEFYAEGGTYTSAIYSWDSKDHPISLSKLREFFRDHPQCADYPIEYDFEDGYIFRIYSTAILTDDYLVLL